jgi:hypothetical protein
MLLGAAEMCKIAEKRDSGNIVNYFKDSVYVHARILYEFFTNADYKNDASIVQFGGQPTIVSTLYSESFRQRLNRRVMHMSHARGQNVTKEPVGTTQLNEQIQDIADDIRQLFQQWINACPDAKLKTDLIALVDEAEKQASDDPDRW